MTSPEHIAMLNGRMAALQAATADLFERGALRSSGAHDVVAGPAAPGMTDLQKAVHRAVANGTLHLERDRDVIAQLDLLQRDCVRRGLLHPPRRARRPLRYLAMTIVLGFVCLLLVGSGAPVALMLVPVVFVAVIIVRAVIAVRRGKDRRTKAGIATLRQARAGVSTAAPLGVQVGAFGTRPLMVAFPAAAALSWPITDFDDPHVQAQRLMGTGSGGASCSSWTSGSDTWCSGGNSCGSGGSCNSGSCGSSGCGGGSSCGGGGFA